MTLGDKKGKQQGVHRKDDSDSESDEGDEVEEKMDVDMVGGKMINKKAIRKNFMMSRATHMELKKMKKRVTKSQ